LLAESRPEEIEVKSEAAFQRLMSSRSELPMQPRTPRSISDRGRYPEEAVNEDPQREDTPSDDGYDEENYTFPPSSSEPINIPKPVTPAQSVNGDDMSVSESPGFTSMDVDMVSVINYRDILASLICSTRCLVRHLLLASGDIRRLRRQQVLFAPISVNVGPFLVSCSFYQLMRSLSSLR
jgi:hypothetical protein